MNESIKVGEIQVSVVRAPGRKTLGLTVERDGSVTARAPSQLNSDSIAQLLKKRELWLHSKLAQRNLAGRGNGAKTFVTGEGFFYLGRHYRLRVLPQDNRPTKAAPLRLFQSRLLLSADAVPNARDHFIRWYVDAGKRWLEKHLAGIESRVGVSSTAHSVRDLGFRWASCSKSGQLNFHWRTFMLPARVVDYLVTHELCHLLFHDHSQKFWNEVSRVSPNYLTTEAWLKANAERYRI